MEKTENVFHSVISWLVYFSLLHLIVILAELRWLFALLLQCTGISNLLGSYVDHPTHICLALCAGFRVLNLMPDLGGQCSNICLILLSPIILSVYC